MIKARTFIAVSLLLLTACGKDKTTTAPQPPGEDTTACKPIRISLATDFDLSDVSPFAYSIVYNGSTIQSLIRNVGNVSYTYLYNAGVPVKRDKTINTVVSGTDSIFFSGPTVNSIRHYEASKLNDEVKLIYTGATIMKKQFTHYGTTTTTTSYNNYTYTGSLITKIERFSSNGTMYDSYAYTYGTQPNKLFNRNKLIDLYLHIDEDLESVVYDGLLNNDTLISGITYTETGKAPMSYTITYDMNTNGYPTNVKANGKTIVSFEYDCAK